MSPRALQQPWKCKWDGSGSVFTWLWMAPTALDKRGNLGTNCTPIHWCRTHKSFCKAYIFLSLQGTLKTLEVASRHNKWPLSPIYFYVNMKIQGCTRNDLVNHILNTDWLSSLLQKQLVSCFHTFIFNLTISEIFLLQLHQSHFQKPLHL